MEYGGMVLSQNAVRRCWPRVIAYPFFVILLVSEYWAGVEPPLSWKKWETVNRRSACGFSSRMRASWDLLTRGVSIVSIVPLPIVGALVVSSSLHFCGYVLEALELGRMAFTCCSVPHRSQSGRAHSFRGAAVEQSAYIARIFPISSAERKSGVR